MIGLHTCRDAGPEATGYARADSGRMVATAGTGAGGPPRPATEARDAVKDLVCCLRR